MSEGTEILVKIRELQDLDPSIHWFCDRIDTALRQNGRNPNPDRKPSAAESSIGARHTLIIECLQIFAYDSSEIDPQKSFMAQKIDLHLGKCDTCIIEYYKVKQRLMENLRDEYDDDEVKLFAKIFDDRDIHRIITGLKAAESRLLSLPEDKRGKNALETPLLLAIFEALSCEEFVTNQELVREHLKNPFKLLQTNVRLQVTHFVPAATVFLFEIDTDHSYWAMHTWSKYRQQLKKTDFDFAVRGPLSRALALASNPAIDMHFVQLLWCGLNLIIDKLEPDLITHSLRAMEPDVCRLALEHLKYEGAGLRFLMQSIEKLLNKSPKDFWDAMGAIPPTTVVEQVFNNKQYDRFMLSASKDENYKYSALNDMVSWIRPFLASLHLSQQPAVCRLLTFQLLDKLQDERFPEHSRTECFRMGLGVLIWTLRNCNNEQNSDTIGRVAALETLEITILYIDNIMAITSLPPNDQKYEILVEPSLMLVKAALALECNSIRCDQELLRGAKQLPHGYSSYSPGIWKAVVSALDHDSMVLAKAALSSISDLAGLEKFTTKDQITQGKEKSEFNIILDTLTHWVCQILERISFFSPANLDRLFQSPETANALVSSLFSPDASTYEGAVNLIKSISGESARREAIRHLLVPFFETTLNSFSWTTRRIAHKRTFAWCPKMLTTCTDVVDILCDSQDGLLRIRNLSGGSEIKAVENFWEHQWHALTVIYEMTEEWSRRGVGNPAVMKDFCRDTMQFSDHFFDQYSVFASAIESQSPVKQEAGDQSGSGNSHSQVTRKKLLKYPSQTMVTMVKWLRLRDEYLASTSETLICKVLDRLSEVKLTLSDSASDYLEQVITGNMRTILTPQQKASLSRAWESNLSRPIATKLVNNDQSDTSRSHTPHSPTRDRRLKTAKSLKNGIIDLDKWVATAKKSRDTRHVVDDDLDDSDIADEDLVGLSRSVSLYKQHPISKGLSTMSTVGLTSRPAPVKSLNLGAKTEAQKHAAQVAFREKREKEIQAKKKRDAEALAKAKSHLNSNKLDDVGLLGKDHAPKGSGMMVSSDSDTDSTDEIDRELFGGSTKPPKISAAVQEYNASRNQQAILQGPVKKVRQVRTAKDMRARLAPDLSTLHKTILSWDFFHSGDFPPNTARDNYTLVTSTFRNPVEYQTTFEPLLVLEAWQGFLKAKEEATFKPFEIKIASRLTVDSFIEVSTAINIAEGKALGISEADIVLLSKASSPHLDASQPHCLARVFRITRKQKQMEISYRVNSGNDLVSSLVPNVVIFGVRILSTTPLEREYGALLGLKYYDLCDEIVRAKASPLLKYNDKQVEPIGSIYKLNVAQAKAVKSAVDNDAFTLIQGPPGSGKTKTILAIVGALLTETLRKAGGVEITRPQSVNGSGRPQVASSLSKKLLVCAPSNAAVDELVMRLKGGIKSLTGQFHKISVIRLGRTDNINTNVMDVTLDELVSAKLNTTGKKSSTETDIGKTMLDHKAVSEKLNALYEELKELKMKGQAQTPEQSQAVEVLKRKKQQLSNEIDRLRDSGHGAARDAELSRRKVQQEILDSAHVLCATLSGSGHDMFQNLNIEFETVIIDEAAQSIELSALIPLKYGCAKCIMVGDPKQLPPTVLSREAARFQYEQSLFVRMQSNRPDDVHLLDTQYRMHPDISIFPSQAFYDGKLLDGPGMAKLRARPWHANDLLSPYRFFDVQGTHQSAPKGFSLINIAELEVALQLYDRLIMECKDYDFTGKVGIITPYKSQLTELRSRFAKKYGDTIFKKIEFNTTDAFQGRESEVIIFSCVRASPGRGIGFLSDIRRMNVGITRAKSSLWVLGNSQSLMQGEFWGSLIEDAKRRKCYTQGNILEILKARTIRSMAINQVHGWTPQSVPAYGSVNEDVEMLDSPRPAAYKKRRKSTAGVSTANLTFDATINDQPQYETTARGPSGGNGFNANAMCSWCGSFKHMAMFCDNEEALKTARRCWRCQNFQHTADTCHLERCLECGEFGHLQGTCSNTQVLSNTDKQWLAMLESAQRRRLIRSSEIQRKKAVGDHERAVPVVKATRNTPPPESQGAKIPRTGANAAPLNDRKRRRGSSPPPGFRAPRTKSTESFRRASPAILETPVTAPSKLPEPLQVKEQISSVPAPMANMMREPTLNKFEEGVSQAVTQQSQYPLPPTPSFMVPKGAQPPQIRKKKEVDPFIRRKPPRK